jgi:hypothetical protein
MFRPSDTAAILVPSEELVIHCQFLFPDEVSSNQFFPPSAETYILSIWPGAPPTTAASLIPSDEQVILFQDRPATEVHSVQLAPLSVEVQMFLPHHDTTAKLVPSEELVMLVH